LFTVRVNGSERLRVPASALARSSPSHRVPWISYKIVPVRTGVRPSTKEILKILIVAEHASANFGGEAAIPLHYFRVLRKRGEEVWLLSHSRTRRELAELFPGDERILYVADTVWHRSMWRIGQCLPEQIAYLTTGFLSRIATQLSQRRVVRALIRDQGIDVVHQPIPVSPREPSLLFGFGVPVVIGPMNGGMDYPPGFHRERRGLERLLMTVGRVSATAMNVLMPGKRRAALLLVANQRTREALPPSVSANIGELPENGVDLSLWRAQQGLDAPADAGIVTFVFMGRLVGWKSVDLLLRAFASARLKTPMRLWILGDGEERARLQAIAAELDLVRGGSEEAGAAHFAGWLSQSACMERLDAADCLVLPSLLECGGAVVLEAMSLGKPVIATAWGGPLDYLDASCGILVPANSRDGLVEGIAAAMVKLANSPATRRSMGTRALARVRAEYSWDVKVDRMMGFYAQAERSHAAGGEARA